MQNYVGLIAPVNKEDFDKKISKKNISHKQFLSNQNLIFSNGFFRDSDKDGVKNYKDCFPFDPKKQDVQQGDVKVVSPTTVKVLGSSGYKEYQVQDYNKAQEYIQSKSQGKQISLNEDSLRAQGINQQKVRDIINDLLLNPQTRVEWDKGSEISASRIASKYGKQIGTSAPITTYVTQTGQKIPIGEAIQKGLFVGKGMNISPPQQLSPITQPSKQQMTSQQFVEKFGGQNMVSTPLGVMSQSQLLNRQKTSKQYVANGITGNAVRESSKFFSKLGTGIRNLVGDASDYKENYEKEREVYNPQTGFYEKVSATGWKGTPEVRPPTPEQKKVIEQKQYEGDLYGRAITGVPSQMLGGIFTTPTTEEEKESVTGFSFLNPKKQYEIFKGTYDYEKDISQTNKISTQLEKLNKDYEEEKIDYSKYSAKWTTLSQDPAYQRVVTSPERTTIYQDISKSKLTSTQKNLLTGGVALTEFGTFAAAPVRVIRGAESLVGGFERYGQAETKAEKVGAGVEVGVGGLLVGSGLGGGTSLFGGLKGYGGRAVGGLARVETRAGITGGIGQRLVQFGGTKTGRITGAVVGETPAVGFSGLYGAGVYEQTGDIGMGISAGVGAYGGIRIPESASKFRKDPLTKKEVELLEKDLKKLEQTEITDTTIIKVGEGTKINSDKVEVVGTQKYGDFERKIKVTGDLVRDAKGNYFFPEGEGTSIITGKFKAPKQTERLFTNVQSFEVGAKGKGINLNQIGRVTVGTSVGSSTYIPKTSITQTIKNPKNFFGQLKENIRIKVKPAIKEYGGTIRKEVDIDTSPKTLSMKVDKEGSPLTTLGVSKTLGRKGTFFEIKRPPEATTKFKVPSRIKKTSFSKTFGETEPVKSQVDLVSPRIRESRIQPQRAEPSQEISLLNRDMSPRQSSDVQGLSESIFKTTRKIDLNLGKLSEGRLMSERTFTKGITRLEQQPKLKEPQKEKQRQDTFSLLSSNLSEGIKQEEELQSKTIQIVTPVQSLITKQVTQQTQPPTFYFGEQPLPRPEPEKPFGLFPDLDREKPEFVKAKGYIPLVKVEGTKKPRYEQLSDTPLTRESALSSVARRVDQGIEAMGKIVGAKPKTDKKTGKEIKARVLNTKDKYFKQNAYKFRGWTQRKGAKIGLKNTLIEKRKYRLDSPREVRTIIKSKKKRTPFGF